MKKLFKNQKGVTFLELMIVIGVIAIITGIFVLNIKGSVQNQIRLATEGALADLKYARNLATSRVVHDFGGGVVEYPDNGYGVRFDNSGTYPKYWIFADRGTVGWDSQDDAVGSQIILENSAVDIQQAESSVDTYYISFISEDEISTDIVANDASKYVVEIIYPAAIEREGYRGVLLLGEESVDGHSFANIGYLVEDIDALEEEEEPDIKEPKEIWKISF